MELKIIAELIFLLIILLIIMIIVVGPVISQGHIFGNQIDFREFCIHWSMDDYSEGAGQSVTIGNNQVSVTDTCAGQIGKSPNDMRNPDIENCKNLCRAKT